MLLLISIYFIGASIWGIFYEYLHTTLLDDVNNFQKPDSVEKVFNFLFWPLPFIIFTYSFFKEI